MSAYLDQLFESYRSDHKIADDLHTLAATEKRDLTPEEQERVDKAREAATSRYAEIQKVQNFEQVATAADAFRTTAAPVVESARTERRDATDGEMLRLVLRDGGGYESKITRRSSGDPTLALRALSSGSQGPGTAVETTFADFVTVFERTFTPMLRDDVVSILNRSDGSPLILPRVTADPNHGGTVTAEAGGILEADMTLASIQLNPYKYGITNLWSSELGDDNTIGLEDLIARTTGRELAMDIGAHLTTGDGNAKPNGFISAAANGGTAVGTGTTFGTYFGYTDLVSLFYGRAAPYRTVGTWQANSTSLAQIRSQRDTAGNPLWQASMQLGQPETVLGRPIYENPAMANGSAAKAVAFGDFGRYYVARVVPIRVESSIHYKFSTDQLALRTIERVDGDLADTDAIAYLVNAAV